MSAEKAACDLPIGSVFMTRRSFRPRSSTRCRKAKEIAHGKPILEGYHRVTPYLILNNAGDAIALGELQNGTGHQRSDAPR